MAPLLNSLANQTLDNTVGAVFLGVVGAGFLFGVTTLQLYYYYHSYPNDTRIHRISVGVLWLLDTLHFVLTVHAVYLYVVTGFGDVLGLMRVQWSIKLQVLVNVVIIVIVHSLYTHRIWKLSGYHQGILGYITILIVIAAAGIGAALAYLVFTVKSYSDLDRISWAITAGLGTSTAIDFFITVAMCYYLRKSLGTGSRLNSRISVVIQYTMSSGLMTSACSLTAMFCWILLPNTFLFLGLEFLLTKLYVASFLAMLNARERSPQDSYSLERGDSLTSLPSTKKIRKHTSSFWSPNPLPQLTIPVNATTRHVSFPSEDTKVGLAF